MAAHYPRVRLAQVSSQSLLFIAIYREFIRNIATVENQQKRAHVLNQRMCRLLGETRLAEQWFIVECILIIEMLFEFREKFIAKCLNSFQSSGPRAESWKVLTEGLNDPDLEFRQSNTFNTFRDSATKVKNQWFAHRLVGYCPEQV